MFVKLNLNQTPATQPIEDITAQRKPDAIKRIERTSYIINSVYADDLQERLRMFNDEIGVALDKIDDTGRTVDVAKQIKILSKILHETAAFYAGRVEVEQACFKRICAVKEE